MVASDRNITYRYYLQSLQAIQRVQAENGAPDMAEYGFQSLKYINSDVVLDGGFRSEHHLPVLPAILAGHSTCAGREWRTRHGRVRVPEPEIHQQRRRAGWWLPGLQHRSAAA